MPIQEPTPATPIQPPALNEQEGSTRDTESAREIGGREGPDPTRYGDWEKNGRCIDF